MCIGLFPKRTQEQKDELKLNKVKKQKENQEEYCKSCKIKLKCMANYNKYFSNNTDSCCGFSNLIYKYSTQKEDK